MNTNIRKCRFEGRGHFDAVQGKKKYALYARINLTIILPWEYNSQEREDTYGKETLSWFM